MQLRYEYKAELLYIDANKKTYTIPSHNIRHISINKEYDTLNMPIVMMELYIDKTMGDILITDMKDGVFILSMYKINMSEPDLSVEELYFTNEFTYIIDADVNKMKDIDYAKGDDNIDNNKEILRSLKVGLIPKTLNDVNLTPKNLTIYDTSMQDIVLTVLDNGLPLLVEPFTYSTNVEQLILPPKESISKTLEYLNNIRAFYETGYRFFMDFDNTYLVSKSGTPTPKNTDKYEVVNITLVSPNDSEALVLGMSDDQKTKSYKIIIQSNDVKYHKDYLVDKELDGITAVVDASKAKQDIFLKSSGFGGILGAVGNVAKTFKKIEGTVNTIKKVTSEVRQNIRNVNRTIDDIKTNARAAVAQATNFEPVMNDIILNIKNYVKDIPQQVIDENEDLKRMIGVVERVKRVYDSGDIFHTVQDDLVRYAEQYSSDISNMEQIGGLVGGIQPNSVMENIEEINNHCWNMPNDQLKLNKMYEETIIGFKDKYKSFAKDVDTLVDDMRRLPEIVKYTIKDPNDPTGQTKITKSINAIILKDYLNLLEDDRLSTEYVRNEVDRITGEMGDAVKTIVNIGGTLSKSVDRIKDIPLNFQQKVIEADNSNIINSITKQRKDNNGILSPLLGGSSKPFSPTNQLSSIISGTLQDIKSLGDLSSIGISGESLINIPFNNSNGEKRKIIRIPDDNMNLLKNINHDMELTKNIVVLNKTELDNSVINPNMKFTIHNKGTNEDKSGSYLLISKQESYLNYGENFTCNTIMTFAKIPE